MESLNLQLTQKSKVWLANDVFPLWLKKGVDHKTGGFIESLTFNCEPMDVPRRAMVQARQAYAMLTGANIGCLPKDQAYSAVERGIDYMIEHFSTPSGAFIYSINPDGTPKITNPDLYTQAFALFGLAQAYIVTKDLKYKNKGKELIQYLKRERSTGIGGYTELDDRGNISFKSNPHMHLFESAIAWMQIDGDQEWKDLGHELVDLALNKFIDSKTHILGEYFDAHWNHLLENGNFIYEPGHQFEWAWLMSLYESLTGRDLKKVRHQLFTIANQYGTSTKRKIAFDEMWSNQEPKLTSSRFWPQCERIKAAVRLGTEVEKTNQAIYIRAADDAMEALLKFFETPQKGLWFDQMSASDTFNGNSAKGSSLYHIINAMEEYFNFRSKLNE